MGGQTPGLRAPSALRTSSNDQILVHMENFSTPPLASVPRLANVATLAIVLVATWWSGAQRPLATPIAVAVTSSSQSSTVSIQPAVVSVAPVANGQNRWPSQTTAMPLDGLQAVGYQPATRR